ncbi:Tissue factor pathway inhibitor-like 3 [Homarus americanus]|uniref:Tissue factor pathway inhibitor-like 3 n=1 Tax=Homarus americanus TaxID=6706 RepID=A0A8J5TBZ4_HOMAM|nr:Tissue factor pathway inhibitor-like 3 [Homarus americanus]
METKRYILFTLATMVVVVNGHAIAGVFPTLCLENQDPGPCLAFIPSYYYNPSSKSCDCFVYGGCEGNANRFHTLEQCMDTCSVVPSQQKNTINCDKILKTSNPLAERRRPTQFGPQIQHGTHSQLEIRQTPNFCLEHTDPGPCRAIIPSFYYNPKTKACDCFVYGGCGGNGNNFHNLRRCMESCGVATSHQKNTASCTNLLGESNPLAKREVVDQSGSQILQTLEPQQKSQQKSKPKQETQLTSEHKQESQQTTELPKETQRTTEPQQETQQTTELPKETQQTTEPQQDTQQMSEPQQETQQTTEPQQETQQMSESEQESQQTTELSKETQQMTELPKETQQTTVLQQETQQMSEAKQESQQMTELQQETQQTTELPNETQQTTEPKQESQQMTEPQQETQQTTEPPQETQQMTKPEQQSQQATELPKESQQMTEPQQETQQVPNLCFDPPVTGLCRAHFPHFYFNSETQTCDCFVYGGCGGNDNKFSTLEECLTTCGGQPSQQHNTESCDKIHGSQNPLVNREPLVNVTLLPETQQMIQETQEPQQLTQETQEPQQLTQETQEPQQLTQETQEPQQLTQETQEPQQLTQETQEPQISRAQEWVRLRR